LKIQQIAKNVQVLSHETSYKRRQPVVHNIESDGSNGNIHRSAELQKLVTVFLGWYVSHASIQPSGALTGHINTRRGG
jgi:hypothetical protein